MANATKRINKDGTITFEIQVSRGRGKAPYSMRWQAPETWSEKVVQRELSKVCADFERRCKNGEVLTKKEQKAEREHKAEEERKIQTVEQYATKVFMPRLVITSSEHTRDSFQRNIDTYIIPAIGKTKMPEVKSEQISALLLKMQTPKDKGGNGLKIASVIKVYSILNLIFKQAYLEHVILANPMFFVARPKATKSEGKKKDVESFDESELKHILSCLNNEPLQWRTMIYLMAFTGARKGEIVGLTWDCIDLKNGTVTIKNTLNYTTEKGVYVDCTKNGKQRIIDIDGNVVNLLKSLKDDQIRAIRAKMKKEGKKGIAKLPKWVFVSDDLTSPVHPDSPTRFCKRMEKKYGIKDFHPHKLRHSFASIAITNGADVVSVSEILGHSDVAVTLRVYSHSNEEARKRASSIFNNAITAQEAK